MCGALLMTQSGSSFCVAVENASPAGMPTWAEWAYLEHPLNPSGVLSAGRRGRRSLSLTSPLIWRVIDGPGGDPRAALNFWSAPVSLFCSDWSESRPSLSNIYTFVPRRNHPALIQTPALDLLLWFRRIQVVAPWVWTREPMGDPNSISANQWQQSNLDLRLWIPERMLKQDAYRWQRSPTDDLFEEWVVI